MKLKKLGIYIGLLLFFLNSCGSIKDAAEGDDSNSTDPKVNTDNFYGIWKGFLEDKREENSSDLIPVILTLNTDDTFKLTSDKDSKAISEGEFEKFSDSIIFSAKVSNISIFALQGNNEKYDFRLVGESLELFNSNSMIDLKLKDAFKSDEQESATQEGYIGIWQGVDRSANQWRLTINDGNTFSSIISNNRNVPSNISGTYSKSKDSKGLSLKVAVANEKDVVGSILEVILTTDDSIELKLIDQNGKSLSQFKLNRL